MKQHKKKLLTTIAVLVIIVGCTGIFWLKSEQDRKQSSSSLGAQESGSNTKNGPIDPSIEERVKNGGGSGQGQETAATGGVIDTGGQGVTNQASGISSQSGNITLYSPTSDEKVSGTIAVKGAAKTSVVYYRVNDNVSGMIGSGQLSVNNGYFSGTLAVTTSATKGSFEIYSFDSQGREIDNIKVELRY